MDASEKKLLLLFISVLNLLLCSAETEGSGDDVDVPVFTQSVYRTSIQEHFPFQSDWVRQLIVISPPIEAVMGGRDGNDEADDGDVGSGNRSLTYGIVSGNEDGFFSMATGDGALHLERQVDREAMLNDRFSLLIRAAVGTPSASGGFALARLTIDVIDVNDNAPQFDCAERNISVVENSARGLNVVQLSAVDPDLGVNGKFHFQVDEGGEAFLIDPTTGWLSVNDSTLLDREQREQLDVWVRVIEDTPSMATATRNRVQHVAVKLIDVNDNSPVFQPTNFYSFSVDEFVQPGTIIGQVKALDADEGENSKVVYTIKNPRPKDPVGLIPAALASHQEMPFSVHPRSGHVMVADTPLESDTYTIVIEATDQPLNLSLRRSSTARVRITVMTRTEQEPRFVNATYEFRISDAAPIDANVGQVKAEGFWEDRDVRYTIKHKFAEPVPFSVDPQSGTIRVTDELGRYSSTAFRLNVTASDGHSQARADLTVHVSGQSRRGARLQSVYRFRVRENLSRVLVGRLVYPQDSRRKPRKNIEFVALDDGMPEGLVLSTNGSIFARRILDRETTPSIAFSARVVTSGTRRVVDTVQILIDVDDVNDNAPIFASQRYVGDVDENAPPGTQVRFDPPILAVDPDASPNNITTYSLSGASGVFILDPLTAVIRTASCLDREDRSYYRFQVKASDPDDLSSFVDVDVFVNDVNDNAPEIVEFVPVPGVIALKQEQDRQEKIIICQEGSCSTPINPTSITGRSFPSFNRFYENFKRMLSVDVHTVGQDLTIQQSLKEILDNSSILIQVPDDVDRGNRIGFFNARDVDQNNLGPFRFKLRGEAYQSFHLDPVDGSLFAKNPLDPGTTYHLSVEVADGEGLQSESDVAVQVIPEECHRPVFDRSLFEMDLLEGSYNQTTLVYLEILEGGCRGGRRVLYSILGNGSHPFRIENTTGLFIAEGRIDREEVESYQLIIQASVQGFPHLETQADVIVYIHDVNDNAPEFVLNQKQDHQVTHGTPEGTLITILNATDADVNRWDNGNVSYFLISHKDQFRIDPWTGNLFTAQEIKYDLFNEANVSVIATDQGSPSLNATSIVRIRVVPCPSQSDPALNQFHWNVSLAEDVAIPYLIINLTQYASDGLQSTPTSLDSDFIFDPDDYTVWLNETQDREKVSRYVLTFRGQSTSDIRPCQPDMVDIIVNVNIIDVNDNYPIFDMQDNHLIFPVDSDTKVGHLLTHLKATDADEGLNAEIAYSLETAGPPLLRIDSRSGNIFTESALNEESGRLLDYSVRATDRNGSLDGKSSLLQLSIHVVDRGHQIALLVENSTQQLTDSVANISLMIQNITGLNVWVKGIEPYSNDRIRTDLFIYACNLSSQHLMSSDQFLSVLDSKRDQLIVKMSEWNVHLKEMRLLTGHSVFSIITSGALETILIASGVLILIGSLVAVMCTVCWRSKKNHSKYFSEFPMPIESNFRLEAAHKPCDYSTIDNAVSTTDNSTSNDMYVEVKDPTRGCKSSSSFYYTAAVPRNKLASAKSSCPSCHHQCKVCKENCPKTKDRHRAQCIRCGRRLKRRNGCTSRLSSAEMTGIQRNSPTDKRRHSKMSHRKLSLMDPTLFPRRYWNWSLSKSDSASSEPENNFRLAPKPSVASTFSDRTIYEDSLEFQRNDQ